MDDDAPTERELRDLVAAGEREEEVRRRRRARWSRPSPTADASLASQLEELRGAGALVTLGVAGAGPVHGRVVAVTAGWTALVEPTGAGAIVALDAVEDVAADAPATASSAAAEPAAAPELGATLGDALEALAPTPVEVVVRSGRAVVGSLVGTGPDAVRVEADGTVHLVGIGAVGLVRFSGG